MTTAHLRNLERWIDWPRPSFHSLTRKEEAGRQEASCSVGPLLAKACWAQSGLKSLLMGEMSGTGRGDLVQANVEGAASPSTQSKGGR